MNPGVNKPDKPATPPRGEAIGRDFMDLDTDGNGSLSEQEYGISGGPDQPFRIADTDGNGRVSRDEYSKWLKMQSDRTTRNNPKP